VLGGIGGAKGKRGLSVGSFRASEVRTAVKDSNSRQCETWAIIVEDLERISMKIYYFVQTMMWIQSGKLHSLHRSHGSHGSSP